MNFLVCLLVSVFLFLQTLCEVQMLSVADQGAEIHDCMSLIIISHLILVFHIGLPSGVFTVSLLVASISCSQVPSALEISDRFLRLLVRFGFHLLAYDYHSTGSKVYVGILHYQVVQGNSPVC